MLAAVTTEQSELAKGIWEVGRGDSFHRTVGPSVWK